MAEEETEQITIRGHALRLKVYNANLYRANRSGYSGMYITAAALYEGAPVKYFTIHEHETEAYTKRGSPFIKTWRPIMKLRLVDILHRPTRESLSELFTQEARASLDIAFPVQGQHVLRHSDADTKEDDDRVLKAICRLGLDGYAMNTLEHEGNYVFHSEIGLCPCAFPKIELIESKKQLVPPRLPSPRRRTRNNKNKNNNTNRRNRKSPPRATKRSRLHLESGYETP